MSTLPNFTDGDTEALGGTRTVGENLEERDWHLGAQLS